jgi:hypothetical protein
MAGLITPGTRALLLELLAWDRQRVALLEAGGMDCSSYRARQDAAEAALAVPTEEWTRSDREVYQTLIEVRHFEQPTDKFGAVIKDAAPMMPRRAAFRAAAVEILVDKPLREVAPKLFAP